MQFQQKANFRNCIRLLGVSPGVSEKPELSVNSAVILGQKLGLFFFSGVLSWNSGHYFGSSYFHSAGSLRGWTAMKRSKMLKKEFKGSTVMTYKTLHHRITDLNLFHTLKPLTVLPSLEGWFHNWQLMTVNSAIRPLQEVSNLFPRQQLQIWEKPLRHNALKRHFLCAFPVKAPISSDGVGRDRSGPTPPLLLFQTGLGISMPTWPQMKSKRVQIYHLCS